MRCICVNGVIFEEFFLFVDLLVILRWRGCLGVRFRISDR